VGIQVALQESEVRWRTPEKISAEAVLVPGSSSAAVLAVGLRPRIQVRVSVRRDLLLVRCLTFTKLVSSG
jgi:hypothetical protein